MARVIITNICVYGTAVGCGGFKAESVDYSFVFDGVAGGGREAGEAGR